MKTKILGAILTALIFIIIGYYVIGIDAGVAFSPAYYISTLSRLVDYTTLTALFTALSRMLWGYRGIDMVVQGVFLFAAALSSSVFFREVKRRRK
ncbi:MAG: hypothetical protein ACFFCO_01650 [Promethearchaeota archaeon]